MDVETVTGGFPEARLGRRRKTAGLEGRERPGGGAGQGPAGHDARRNLSLKQRARSAFWAVHWGLTVPLVRAQIGVICMHRKAAAQRSVVDDVRMPGGLTLSRAQARDAALAIADRRSGT